MDIIDRANEYAEIARTAAIANLTTKSENKNSTGVCIDCDDSIKQERLQAMPFTLRCLDCQRAFEIRSRR